MAVATCGQAHTMKLSSDASRCRRTDASEAEARDQSQTSTTRIVHQETLKASATRSFFCAVKDEVNDLFHRWCSGHVRNCGRRFPFPRSVARDQRDVPMLTLSTTVGSGLSTTARGTSLSAPVSEKKVLDGSSPPRMVCHWASGPQAHLKPVGDTSTN